MWVGDIISNTVCLNMIVKDESPVIERCLESVYNIIDSYVIVDTGSSDDTPGIIESFFKEKGIPGKVYHSDWVSFEHNRNEALEFVINDTDAKYALFIDADEIFHCTDPVAFRESFSHNLGVYLIEKHYGGLRYRLPAIPNIRDYNWEWKGVVHEAITAPGQMEEMRKGELSMAHITAKHGEGVRSRGKTLEEKFSADAELLEMELEKNPDDLRSLFYLAQSYRDAGDKKKALLNYKKRAELDGWQEEKYFAQFQTGLLMLHSDDYTYEEAADNLLKACKLHRLRSAEPLYHLVAYCRSKGLFAEGCFWGQAAMSFLKVPPHDILFVPHAIYDFKLIDELSICLCQVNDVHAGFNLMNGLMHKQGIPGDVRCRIFRNINIILNSIPMLAKPEMT